MDTIDPAPVPSEGGCELSELLAFQRGPGAPFRAPWMRGAQAWAGPPGATLDKNRLCIRHMLTLGPGQNCA